MDLEEQGSIQRLVEGGERERMVVLLGTPTAGSTMMVALTLTHGNSFGAQVTVNGLGLVLGHGMSRFEPRPGLPNSVAPRKRPLHNMCPMVALRGGKPVLAIGGAGGRRIVNSVLEVLARWAGRGESIADALAGPRLQTDGSRTLALDAKWPESHREHLRGIGYTLGAGAAAASVTTVECAPP